MVVHLTVDVAMNCYRERYTVHVVVSWSSQEGIATLDYTWYLVLVPIAYRYQVFWRWRYREQDSKHFSRIALARLRSKKPFHTFIIGKVKPRQHFGRYFCPTTTIVFVLTGMNFRWHSIIPNVIELTDGIE